MIKNIPIGPKDFVVMAGPCSVESERSNYAYCTRGKKIRRYNFTWRSAYKPEVHRMHFKGWVWKDFKFYKRPSKETGMPVVSEAMDLEQVEIIDGLC